MKLWVDDIRNAPNETWHVARTAIEAIRTIARFKEAITEISLDHDISHQVQVGPCSRPFPCEETFASVAYYIAAIDLGPKGPKITIHSSNVVAGDEMRKILLTGGYIAEHKPMGAANRLEMNL